MQLDPEESIVTMKIIKFIESSVNWYRYGSGVDFGNSYKFWKETSEHELTL
jgi:hypothetical protein